jgi:hypothetical protein
LADFFDMLMTLRGSFGKKSGGEMETTVQQIANLRLEIAAAIWQLTIGMWLITALAVLVYLLAATMDNDKHYLLTMVLITSGLFFVAREDYLIHRPAGFIRAMETAATASTQQSWEFYKNSLVSTYAFLPILDVLSGLVWIYLFWDGAAALRKSDRHTDINTNRRFLFFTTAGFFIGWAAPFVATLVADK